MGVPVMLPRFRGSYVKLDKKYPKKDSNPPKSQYSIMALFPKGTDLSKIREAIEQAAEAKWPGKGKARMALPAFKNPLRPQEGLVDKATLEPRAGTEPGAYFLNLSTENAFLLIGPDKQPVTDFTTIYSGAYYVAKGEAFAFEHLFWVSYRFSVLVLSIRDS